MKRTPADAPANRDTSHGRKNKNTTGEMYYVSRRKMAGIRRCFMLSGRQSKKANGIDPITDQSNMKWRIAVAIPHTFDGLAWETESLL